MTANFENDGTAYTKRT